MRAWLPVPVHIQTIRTSPFELNSIVFRLSPVNHDWDFMMRSDGRAEELSLSWLQTLIYQNVEKIN